MNNEQTVAYFSMEIALKAGMPTYSGGLGVLAGDTIRSAADLAVPMVAVSLLYKKGYFYQRLDAYGHQSEEGVEWVANDFLQELPERATVTIEGRPVQIIAWQFDVIGVNGYCVPVYLLDTDLPENSEYDRRLTDYLYGGDKRYRLCQEVILGIGGLLMLRALGYERITRYHMNEGHASLLALKLLEEETTRTGKVTADSIEKVREQAIFTTHTPVPSGHDKFPLELACSVVGMGKELWQLPVVCRDGETLNLTYLALNLSRYVNGVAKRHSEVSRLMFAGYHIDAITNGVHAASWVAAPFAELYDRYMPSWREDNFCLRAALNIPRAEIWQAHTLAKRELIHYVNRCANIGMDKDFLTLGFARRATAYKRAELLFEDIDRLKSIAAAIGPLQLVFAGKAHPNDKEGKEIIANIFQMKERLRNEVKVAYLENYDIELAKLLTSGVDVWLNTPLPPNEASGTSGMKAALNGVPSLSVLDGWWIEGHIEGITGWAIGKVDPGRDQAKERSKDALYLYEKLEGAIAPAFYHNLDAFTDVMRHTIALNGSYFNTHRMMQQYVLKAYFP